MATTPTSWPVAIALLALLAAIAVAAQLGLAQSNHDNDEEELQIGRAGGDLWNARPHHSAGERAGERRSPTRKRENELLDPFVFTFEDYLREAAGSSSSSSSSSAASHHHEHEHDSHQRRPQQAESDDNLIGELPPDRRANLIVEEEEQQDDAGRVSSSRNNENNIDNNDNNKIVGPLDYIFPATAGPAQQPANEGEADQEGAAGASQKPMFAWRSLPTNKCSRPCGRGARLNHLSCLDLKYQVRVEDELCSAAGLRRPSELSEDEPCNEFDCEPAWQTIAEQSAGSPSASADGSECNRSGKCNETRKLFKRFECTMINRHGHLVRLDESHCATSGERTPESDERAPIESRISEGDRAPSNELDEEDLSIDLNEQLDRERNEILSSNDLTLDHDRHRLVKSAKGVANHLGKQHGRHAQLGHAEPFIEPGEWSECSGALCGQLGKRRRQLTCRLHLARSAKFVELPLSSCANEQQQQFEREQPCYMDCGPVEGARGANDEDEELTIEALAPHSRRHEYKLADKVDVDGGDGDDDEVILDPAATRHVWRHATDWTKCSAECLGGTSESLVECWDRVTNSSVDQSQCELGRKLQPLRRTCNEIPCAPEWRLGPITACSRPCGSTGTRQRSLACVQRVPANSPSGHLLVVSNDLCLEAHSSPPPPNEPEPCNRHACRPEWSVGPWGECEVAPAELSAADKMVRCGQLGQRNRTVICVQEFASQWGPLEAARQLTSGSGATNSQNVSADLREAIELAAKGWQPGAAIQVPFGECYGEYHSVPHLTESCEAAPPISAVCQADLYLDAEPGQDYRMLTPDGSLNQNYQMKRRTVTLKVGGRAQLLEGRHVKIRCRVLSKSGRPVSNSTTTTATNSVYRQAPVEWRKDGVRIFAPNTTMAERLPIEEPLDNSIQRQTDAETLGGDMDNELSINFGQPAGATDKYGAMMVADEPEIKRTQRLASKQRAIVTSGKVGRKLSVRSWPLGEQLDYQLMSPSTPITSSMNSYQFVPQPGGRFTLVKENTLRIKRLKLDDSGLYTCSSGPNLSESIEITVLSKQTRQLQLDAMSHHHHQSKHRHSSQVLQGPNNNNSQEPPISSSSSSAAAAAAGTGSH